MANKEMKITRARGGTAERIVPLSKIVIPDLWHVADHLKAIERPESAEAVLECWHLCHDLKNELEQRERAEEQAPLV